MTRRVPGIAADPSQPNAFLWNPAGASLEAAIGALAIGAGSVAVIGGTEVFDLFLPLYDAFHLTRAARANIPDGRPVFSQVGPHKTPEDVLAGALRTAYNLRLEKNTKSGKKTSRRKPPTRPS